MLYYGDASLQNSSQVLADVALISDDEEMPPVDALPRGVVIDDDDPAVEGAAYEAEATALEQIARTYDADGDHCDGDPASQEAGALAVEEATIARIAANYDNDADHAGALERTADHVTTPEDRLQELLQEYESVVAGSMLDPTNKISYSSAHVANR